MKNCVSLGVSQNYTSSRAFLRFQAWDQPPKRGSSPEGTAENARIYRLLLFHAFLPVTIAGTQSRHLQETLIPRINTLL